MIRHCQVHLVSITLAKTSLPASPVTSYIDKTVEGYPHRYWCAMFHQLVVVAAKPSLPHARPPPPPPVHLEPCWGEDRRSAVEVLVMALTRNCTVSKRIGVEGCMRSRWKAQSTWRHLRLLDLPIGL